MDKVHEQMSKTVNEQQRELDRYRYLEKENAKLEGSHAQLLMRADEQALEVERYRRVAKAKGDLERIT